MIKKRNVCLVFILILAIILGMISAAYAVTHSNGKDTNNIMVRKTEKRLETAYNDIIKTLNLNTTLKDYRKIDFQSGNDKIDFDIAQEFANLDQSPIGSTVPQFYLKNDLSEVLVLYKESDGTNVMKYAQKVNGKWVEGEKRIKGYPILDLDAIKIE